MNNDQNDYWSRYAETVLLGMKWTSDVCTGCGRKFYYKSYSDAHTSKRINSNCQSAGCSKSGLLFKSLQKKKLPTSPEKINNYFLDFFSENGFKTTNALNMQNEKGKTDLVIAGVQIFDDVLHQGFVPDKAKLALSQPCVRMQYKDLIGIEDGISTAFVNLCTESIHLSFEQHMEDFNKWLTFLSRVGLHAQDITLVQRFSEKDRGNGIFSLFEIFFLYGGLEIGDASYALIPSLSGQRVPISDIGFGLERIVWALNKSHTYYSFLIPFSSNDQVRYSDYLRTSALLSLSGIKPSNKGPGLQLRRFCKSLSELAANQFSVTFQYYHNYWSNFISPTFDSQGSLEIVTMEIDRFINLRVSDAFGFPPPQEESKEAYMRRLVYNYGIDINEVKNAFQNG